MHNKCGYTYKVTPTHFLTGKRCPYCFGTHKKTDKQFKKEVYDLVEDEYTFLETYQGNHTKIKVKHNECGLVYSVQPSDFLQGKRCPNCFGTHKKTDDQFKHEIYDIVGDEYYFIDSYVNAQTNLKVRHNKCGNVYMVKPANFLQGKRCPYCFGTPKKNNACFKQEVYNLVGTEYLFLDTYVNGKTKLRVKHDKCGHIYKVKPNAFFSGCRCPYCNISHGEDFINKILKSLGTNYEYQKSFDDLRDIQPLSYDFYIPDQNILIEYQGRQHYQPIDYFGGEPQFKLQQKHDKMKSDYAKSHRYNLIAVPYTEDTLSKIKRYLLQHGLTK